MLGDLLEPPGAKTVQLSLLAPDDRDDRPVPPAHERHERREVEVAADLRAVPDGLRQRERPPEVVEPGREDREPLGAVPVEVVVEPVPDPLEVGLQGRALLVGQVGPVGLVRRVQHGVHPGLDVTGGRDVGRIEVEAEADRTALLRPEAGQLTQGDQVTVPAIACPDVPCARGFYASRRASSAARALEASADRNRLIRRKRKLWKAMTDNDIREMIIIGGGPPGTRRPSTLPART